MAGLPPAIVGGLLALSWALLPLAEGWGVAALAGVGVEAARVVALGVAAGVVLWVPVSMALAHRFPRVARVGVMGAVVVAVGGLAMCSLGSPIRFLGVVALGMGALAGLAGWFRVPPELSEAHRRPAGEATAGAVVGVFGVWGVVLAVDATSGLAGRAALAGAAASAGAWVVLRAAGGPGAVRRWCWAALAVAPLPLVPGVDGALALLPALVLLPGAALRSRALVPRRGRPVVGWPTPPAAVSIVGAFAGAGLLGAVLLSLPVASASGVPLAFVDALFTSFSAVCVTGLVVVDTSTALSGVGQAVVLGLIQLGGLGIMTFSTAALLLLGRRMSVSHEATVATLVEAGDRRRLADRVRWVFKATAVCEGVGAAVLAVAFWAGGDGVGMALWRGVFTAVSAFCNAGFALQSDSLVGYAGDPVVLGATGVLIVAGGLGPLLVAAWVGWSPAQRRAGRARAPVGVRLALVTTGVLVGVGFVAFVGYEWNRTLGGLSGGDKLVNALFQSVTLRTAGFNSVDFAELHPATYTVMVPLMFVGGCPGSTAGGIKTTTLAILVLLVRAAFRDAAHIEVFGYQIAPQAVRKATAVSFVGVSAAVLLLLALLATQPMTLELALFEAVSALGTVGLSVGGTALLDEVGKLLVTAAMLAGRVGPLTLLLVLAGRIDPSPPVRRPMTDIAVG